MDSTAASRLQGPRFNSRLGSLCVEFVHSPRVCVGFLWVLRFPPTIQKMCSLGGGGTVAQWLAPQFASQLQGPGFDSQLGSLSVWSSHIPLVSAWVSSGCSGFLPQSKDVWVRLIGHAKIAP